MKAFNWEKSQFAKECPACKKPYTFANFNVHTGANNALSSVCVECKEVFILYWPTSNPNKYATHAIQVTPEASKLFISGDSPDVIEKKSRKAAYATRTATFVWD